MSQMQRGTTLDYGNIDLSPYQSPQYAIPLVDALMEGLSKWPVSTVVGQVIYLPVRDVYGRQEVKAFTIEDILNEPNLRNQFIEVTSRGDPRARQVMASLYQSLSDPIRLAARDAVLNAEHILHYRDRSGIVREISVGRAYPRQADLDEWTEAIIRKGF